MLDDNKDTQQTEDTWLAVLDDNKDTQQTDDTWPAVLDDNKDTTQQTEDTWPAVLDDNNRACYLPEDSATSFNAISMLSPSTNANDRLMQPAHKDTCRIIGVC